MLKERASICNLCICKQQQNRWMPPKYFARMRSAWQEDKLGKALSWVMGRRVRGSAARRVGRRLARRQAQWLKDCANRGP